MSVRETNEGPQLTVGQVADLVGVSVRTLHYWHDVGLVVPQGRSHGGYRLYSDRDLDRLYRVLLYRETGMPLATIKSIVDTPGASSADHLEEQKRLLEQRISHLRDKVRAVDTLMKEEKMGHRITAEERGRILGDGWDPAWEDEAEERWGDTDAWRQSSSKVASMSTDDWKLAKATVDNLEEKLARAFEQGLEPGTDEANKLADLHRDWLNQWIDTSQSKQVLMARMYTEDDRFRSHYDDRVPGLAQWVRDIVEANARAHGLVPETVTWE